MRKLTIILTLSFLLLNLLPAQAIKRIDANPINIAFTLSQETDSAKIAATLHYYGYAPSRQTESEVSTSLKTQDLRLKTEYTHPNGSIIRVSFKDATAAQPYPYVEVKSNRGSKETDEALKGLNFEKKGSGYLRNIGQHTKTETHCTHTSQGFLIFHRTKITHQE